MCHLVQSYSFSFLFDASELYLVYKLAPQVFLLASSRTWRRENLCKMRTLHKNVVEHLHNVRVPVSATITGVGKRTGKTQPFCFSGATAGFPGKAAPLNRMFWQLIAAGKIFSTQVKILAPKMLVNQ